MVRIVRGGYATPIKTGPARPARKRAKGPTGICQICQRKTTNALVVRGKWYTDADGQRQKAADALYHRECYRMQNRGLFQTGPVRPVKDSIGKPCGGCNQTIEPDDKHAHRNGVPYHKECLF
jgi:hypothetical protein